MPHFLKDIFLNRVGGNSKTKGFFFVTPLLFLFFNSNIEEESIYAQKKKEWRVPNENKNMIRIRK